MNYELAKQLKEAGFDQRVTSASNYLQFKDTGIAFNVIEHNYYLGKNYVKNPTLSELIDACGAKFISLERLRDGVWECVGTDKFGKTPEEAVAKLWLKLQEK